MSNPFTPRRQQPRPGTPTPAPARASARAPVSTPAPAAPAEPTSSPPTSAPPPEAPGSGVTRAPLPSRAQLDDMRKADLQELCRARDVEYAGDDTRAELIEKLEQTR